MAATHDQPPTLVDESVVLFPFDRIAESVASSLIAFIASSLIAHRSSLILNSSFLGPGFQLSCCALVVQLFDMPFKI